jgi:tetratricopeptide (TPR) repeat protein
MGATPPRKDLAQECLRLFAAYLRQNIADLDAAPGRLADEEARKQEERELTGLKQHLEQLQKAIDQEDANLRSADTNYVNFVAATTSPLDRAALARRFGLIRKAIEELERAQQQFEKRMANEADRLKMTPADQAQYVAVHAELIELLLYAGRAEEAASLMEALDSDNNRTVMSTAPVRDQYFNARRKAFAVLFPAPQQRPMSPYDTNPVAHVRSLRQVVGLAVGQFDAVVTSQQAEASAVRTELDAFVRRSYPNGVPTLTINDLEEKPADRSFLLLVGMDPLLAVDPVRAATLFFVGQARILATQYVALRRSQLDTHARLGLTCLEMGKMDEAVHHFKQTADGPEPPVPLATRRIARTYLDAIAQAEKSAK